LVPWPSIDIHGKFYGDRPRGTAPVGALNARGPNIAIQSVTLNDLERRNGPYFALFH